MAVGLISYLQTTRKEQIEIFVGIMKIHPRLDAIRSIFYRDKVRRFISSYWNVCRLYRYTKSRLRLQGKEFPQTCSKSTSSASFMFLVWIWRISNLPVASGMPMSTSLSKRPACWRGNSQSHSALTLVVLYALFWSIIRNDSNTNSDKLTYQISWVLDRCCWVCWWQPWQWHGLSVSDHP